MFLHSQLRSAVLRAFRAAFASFVKGESGRHHLEVERKFALTAEEAQALPERLQRLGFAYSGTASMTDVFLPTLVDGEMMRVRRERVGEQPSLYVLTFKKWVETASGKERHETERQVRVSVASLWKLAGRVISGQPLLSFSKERKLFDGKLGGSDAVVSIDDVTGLGSYSGFYMEVEVLVPVGGDVVATKDGVFALASQILEDQRSDVKMSYRDMLKQSLAQ